MDIDGADVRRAVEAGNRDRLRVVHWGELTILACGDKLFLYNQSNRRAYEVRPDFESGVTVYAI